MSVSRYVYHNKTLGKPVNTIFGRGYVFEVREETPDNKCKYAVKLKNDLVAYINESAILEEKDSNEISFKKDELTKFFVRKRS
jgi:hypothetical protein